jgi:hypothetical protein
MVTELDPHNPGELVRHDEPAGWGLPTGAVAVLQLEERDVGGEGEDTHTARLVTRADTRRNTAEGFDLLDPVDGRQVVAKILRQRLDGGDHDVVLLDLVVLQVDHVVDGVAHEIPNDHDADCHRHGDHRKRGLHPLATDVTDDHAGDVGQKMPDTHPFKQRGPVVRGRFGAHRLGRRELHRFPDGL